MSVQRRTLPSYALLALLSLAALLPGCAHQNAATPSAKPLTQAEIDAMIKKKAVEDPFLRSQADYGLEARLSKPDRVQATVTNKTDKPIVVGPKCFALIVPGRRQELHATGQSVKLFPLAKVQAGEQVSGELVFPLSPIPKDARLVFVQPPGEPAMAPVR